MTSFRAAILVPIFFLAGGSVTSLAQKSDPSVLLISFDGFRYDYIDKHDLKNFKAFRANGASADGIIPCFPSLTFPNHYSIVTGLLPAHHGLVDNNFYDSALNITYSISNREVIANPEFYGGTPLWTLAKRSGMKTASYFWVGSEIDDEASRPDKFFLYEAKTSFKTRIDSVLSWLNKNDEERPRFITLYFNEPDHEAHDTGPDSPETHAVLLKTDSLLGYLTNGLKKVKAPVNTILVSDHGMSELKVENETFVFLDELFDVKTSKFKVVVSSTLAHLYFDDKPTLDSMYSLLKAKEDRYKVYRKRELHYEHYRVGDLVMIATPSHCIRAADRKKNVPALKSGTTFGVHGYDPAVVADMHGIFLAQGPQIKKGERLGFIRNIDIYPLIARILRLTPPAIDGDPRALERIIKGAGFR